MNLEDVAAICKILGDKFDSHEFILKYLDKFPVSYGELLIKQKKVAKADAEIALFLVNHSAELHIQKTGETESSNLLGNVTRCATWIKI